MANGFPPQYGQPQDPWEQYPPGAQPPPPPYQYGPPQAGPPQPPVSSPDTGQGAAITGLILGIFGQVVVVAGLIVHGRLLLVAMALAFALGAPAVALGLIARRRAQAAGAQNGVATASMVLGFTAVGLAAILAILAAYALITEFL